MQVNLVVLLLLVGVRLTTSQVVSNSSPKPSLNTPSYSKDIVEKELLLTFRCPDSKECDDIGRKMTEAIREKTTVMENSQQSYYGIVKAPAQACFDTLPLIASRKNSAPQRTLERDQKPQKIILHWTGYYTMKNLTKANCKVNTCLATTDRSYLNQSDAIIFDAAHFNASDLPNPKTRSPHQYYIFFSSDPLAGVRKNDTIFKNDYTNYFNWTMIYRRDSDIYIGQLSGAIRRKTPSPYQVPPSLTPGKKPKEPVQLFDPVKKDSRVDKKSKLLLASFCANATFGGREKYVAQLKKYIKDDIYSTECREMTRCEPKIGPQAQCNTHLKEYKFYLVGESSLCPDYITDEFYRALATDIIPVVYGGANYSEYAPPGSYINVADFATPKDLANFLNMLDKNAGLYLKYFDWKVDYEIITESLNGWCDLCAKLNEPIKTSLPAKSYGNNLTKWWHDEIPCYPGIDFLKSKSIG